MTFDSLTEKKGEPVQRGRGFVCVGDSGYANRVIRALMEVQFAEGEERGKYQKPFDEMWSEDRHKYEPTAIKAGTE